MHARDVACFGLLAAACLGLQPANAQGRDQTAKFHVTKVTYADATDWCTSGKCTAKRISVDGFTRKPTGLTVRYKLECVDVTQNDPKDNGPRCPLVNAGGEYFVTLYGSSIAFSKEDDTILYSVISEEEVAEKP